MHRRDSLFEMWEEACRTGMTHTAYGILVDLFLLWDALEDDPSVSASEDQHVGFREDLMRVLGDKDGTDLRCWRKVWACDRVEFQRRALERIECLIEET